MADLFVPNGPATALIEGEGVEKYMFGVGYERG